MLQETLTQLKSETDEMERQLSAYKKRISKAAEIAKNLSNILSEPEIESVVRSSVTLPSHRPPAQIHVPTAKIILTRKIDSDVNLRAGARRMLTALCQWHPSGRTEAQVAAQVQMKRTGGTWAAYKSDLTKGGYVAIQNGMWFATEEGREFLGEDIPETPTTTEDVVRLWGEKLRLGARNMLDILVAKHGRLVTREELGQAVGMEHTGGTFSAYLSDLKQAGLILVDREGIRANTETLFL